MSASSRSLLAAAWCLALACAAPSGPEPLPPLPDVPRDASADASGAGDAVGDGGTLADDGARTPSVDVVADAAPADGPQVHDLPGPPPDDGLAADALPLDAPTDAPPDVASDAPSELGPEVDAGPPTVAHPHVVTLLEDHPVQLVYGVSLPVTVTAPADTVSLTVTVAGSKTEMVALGSWIGPSGASLVPDGWYLDLSTPLCLGCANRIALVEAVFAGLAPNNPGVDLLPGKHTFSAYGCVLDGITTTPAYSQVALTVHAKVMEAPPESGVLDLNLHFTGAQGWTAATAKTDPAFLAILDGVADIYAQASVVLGEVTWNDVDPVFQVIEDVQGPKNDLLDLFEQSAGRSLNAVDLFFVDELLAGTLGGYGVILGIAGGIPGPPLLQGSARSGVAISVKPTPGVTTPIHVTVAHEVGHFLGLFHSTEMWYGYGPEIHDQLPDTPEGDEGNLMFFAATGTELSEWQGRVMRSNPWLRHPEDE